MLNKILSEALGTFLSKILRPKYMKKVNWKSIKKKKILHEWPLSKVELVDLNGQKFILKTIHNDFQKEIKRQDILHKLCKTCIPQVISKVKTEKTLFLMKYLPHKKEKINNTLACKVISKFHKETKNLHHPSFKNYTFNVFYKDYKIVKKHLPSQLQTISKPELANFFDEIFKSPKSIVHGDWHKDQIFKSKGKWCIIDFGKSYRGPSLLDHANYFLHQKNNKKICEELKISKFMFKKAKIISSIITLSWLELCKEKYIKYDYIKEIKEQKELIHCNYKGL
jgi:thiamine kinase-like enzyme